MSSTTLLTVEQFEQMSRTTKSSDYLFTKKLSRIHIQSIYFARPAVP
jgi:hypothetical protein